MTTDFLRFLLRFVESGASSSMKGNGEFHAIKLEDGRVIGIDVKNNIVVEVSNGTLHRIDQRSGDEKDSK